MKNAMVFGLLVLSAVAPFAPVTAFAQLPPHTPGTICATPSFWCQAASPGVPGARCACPSARGWVAGVLV